MATSSSLARAASLEAGEWRILLEAATLITVLRITLLIVPVRRVVAWCTAVRGGAPAAMPSREARHHRQQSAGGGAPARVNLDIPRFVRLVEAAARRVPGSQCLVRSLTLTRMLAVRGISSDLRMGVRTENGRLTAHAWVERCGQPLNDSADLVGQYEPLDARLHSN